MACYGCTKRHPLCWSDCPEYQRMRADIEAKRAKERAESACSTYTAEQMNIARARGGRSVKTPLREARRREEARWERRAKGKKTVDGPRTDVE